MTNLFEFFRDDALFVRRHFHELRAAELKGVDGAEVGRAFDEDDVAGIDEEIRQVRKALLGTGGDEDFVFRTVDEEGFLHPFTDVLAQGQIAFGRTVLDGARPSLSMTAFVACRSSSIGKSSGAGRPPAKEIISGFVVSFKSSRISEAFKFIATSENCISITPSSYMNHAFIYVYIVSSKLLLCN